MGNVSEVNTRIILYADSRKRNAGAVASWDTISLCALPNSAKVLSENINLKRLSPILVLERSQLLEAQYKVQVSLDVPGKRTSGCKLPGQKSEGLEISIPQTSENTPKSVGP